MKNDFHITLWMAISANGFIATPDNREDFLSHDNWVEFVKAVQKTGCLIWGRKTYEIVRSWDATYLKPFEKIDKVILSKNQNLVLDKGFIHANSPLSAIEILTRNGHKHAILTGGSRTNTAFAKIGRIDEMIINIEGVFIGRGVPLFHHEDFKLQLQLQDVRKISANIIQLKYTVKR